MGQSKEECEKLFLLEVLVDKLSVPFSRLNLDKELLSSLTDTCVTFQFLHYPPLVVCESDFLGSVRGAKEDVTFLSGKSCFFSLRTPRGALLPVPFEVKVTVVGRMKEGVLPEKLEIGRTSIQMSEEFTELLRVNTDENCDSLPLTKSKKGVFDISDGRGTVGTLSAILRLSCFGKLIITQFSLNKDDEKSYLFKGTEANQSGPTNDKGPTPLQQPISLPKEYSRRDSGGRCQETLQVNRNCEQGYQVGNYPTSCRQDGGRMCPPCPPSGMQPPRPYDVCRPPPSRPIGRGQLCECPYPVSPGTMSKYTQRSRKPNLDLTPGEVGVEDDRVVFQLPLKKPGDPLTEKDKQINSSVYYKLTSAEETKEGQEKNTVNITSDDLRARGQAVGAVSGLPVDDKHDVFLLKIGKKCDGDRKRNLELELRTPKMKEPKPEVRDQDTQYLESDLPRPESPKDKGKKGKGGKGKDKKGKKKK